MDQKKVKVLNKLCLEEEKSQKREILPDPKYGDIQLAKVYKCVNDAR